jgi:putative toxin-antitoxin system antitoxin component (TIGR02293 family)
LADLLHVSLKTFQRYRKDNKRLNPAISEHLLKLLALFQQGNEVFGSIDSFNRWLKKPAFGLGNQIPLELLETSGGIDLVMDQLLRIAYGDLA